MRLRSETREPGMTADRRCLACRTPLQADDGDRCIECEPYLNDEARAAGVARRELEREFYQLENLIRRVERALRK